MRKRAKIRKTVLKINLRVFGRALLLICYVYVDSIYSLNELEDLDIELDPVMLIISKC